MRELESMVDPLSAFKEYIDENYIESNLESTACDWNRSQFIITNFRAYCPRSRLNSKFRSTKSKNGNMLFFSIKSINYYL